MIIEPSCAWLYTIFTQEFLFSHFTVYFFPSRNQVVGRASGVLALKAQITVRFPHPYQWESAWGLILNLHQCESAFAHSHRVHVIH